MSAGKMPIQCCDDENGCDQWTVDWYAAMADNWRELMRGWTFDPYQDRDLAFCPEHDPPARGVVGATTGGTNE